MRGQIENTGTLHWLAINHGALPLLVCVCVCVCVWVFWVYSGICFSDRIAPKKFLPTVAKAGPANNFVIRFVIVYYAYLQLYK